MHNKRIILFVALTLSFITVSGKPPDLNSKELSFPPPRIIRTCCSFGADVGIAGIPFFKITDITSIDLIGPHKYLGDKNEANGNIYTKRGGFIDMGHLRDCADWTAYIYTQLILNKEKSELGITELGFEGGTKKLTLNIPEDFDSFYAYELAGKIAYDLSLWHEIATWFGTSFIPLVPERYSSFSPEDLYSNLLGVKIGIQALKSDLEYNEAMTQIIAKTLNELECVKTISETYEAMEKVENLWWSSEKSLPSKKVLIKRYLDTDSFLIPWLLPEDIICQPYNKLCKPDTNLSEYYELSIDLNFKFPVKSIFTSGVDRTITQNDFTILLKYIQIDIENLDLKIAHVTKRSVKRKKKKQDIPT